MASQLLYSFLIYSIEVLDYALRGTKIELQRTNASGNTAEIHLSFNVTDIITLRAGQDVIISRGVASSTEDYKFKGKIKQIKTDKDRYIIVCKDKLQELYHKFLTISYDKNIDPEAGEVSAIFADIVDRGGFTASVVDSGTASTDVVIDQFVSRTKRYLNRLNTLSKLLNWYFFYDYNNDWVRLEPKGTTVYGTTLIVGTNVINIPKWEEDIEAMRNKITVKGAYKIDTRKESEVGDGGTATWDFTYEPESTELTVDGVLQKLGVEDSTETFDYSVDKVNKQYTFETGSIPGIGAAIEMSYTTKVPAPVQGTNPTSVSTYGVTQEDVFEFDDITNIDDAQLRLDQLLNLLAFAETSTTLHTDEYDILPGVKVTVEDSTQPDKNGDYIVHNVIINYGEPYDIVVVGSQRFNVNDLFETINERLKAIELKEGELFELLTQTIDIIHTFKPRRRYAELESRDISTDCFVFGHPEYGIFGTSKFGETGATAWTTIGLVQGNNTYNEYLYDTDFKDEVNTTGTWDTINKRLDFVSGQVVYTSKIAIGTAYTSYTVTLGTVTGTVTTEISGDGGSTWQTVTLGNLTNFTTSTEAGVIIRITESGSSTARIEPINNSFGERDIPAIKCILGD